MTPKMRIRSNLLDRVVGERSLCAEVVPVRGDGAQGSENVGMSSRKRGENPFHRKPKVSWATTVDPG